MFRKRLAAMCLVLPVAVLGFSPPASGKAQGEAGKNLDRIRKNKDKIRQSKPSPTPDPTPTTDPLPDPTPTTDPLPDLEPCDGVWLLPLSDLQAEIDGHAPGTTFCLVPGTYELVRPLKLKDAQGFIGEAGATLTGGGSARHAFLGNGADGVTVKGFVIEDFDTPMQRCAIDLTDSDATDWVIQDNEIRNNSTCGIYADTRAQVINNFVHHNGQIGIKANGKDVLFEGNEVAFNLTRDDINWEWEGGGSKFVNTDGLVLRGNYVHDNNGPGLWSDINNINTTYEDNVIEDNLAAGIFHEISYDAVIRRNTINRNGLGKTAWLWGAGIVIAASPNVEIYDNILEGNADGIGIIQQNRPDGATHGPHVIDNISVHDNVIKLDQGSTGAVQDIGDKSVFDRVTFENNTYHLDAGKSRWFEWDNGARTTSEWKSYGNDLGGSFYTL